MKIELYRIKETYENGRIRNFREVSVTLKEEYILLVHCCDMNATCLESFGDFGAEFHLQLTKDATLKLANCLMNYEVKNEHELGEKLLLTINDRFGGVDSCFEDLMSYFKTNQIDYEYSRW